MMRRLTSRLAVAGGGLAVALAAGAGVASAEPDIGPLVNSPCSYDQAMAALNAENPMASQLMNKYPANKTFLQVFLSKPAGSGERTDLLNQIKNNPGANQALPVFTRMLTSCVNY